MNAEHLTNYMKDHFAGSVAAVQLLNQGARSLLQSNVGSITTVFGTPKASSR
jgi:hypothetical protein